jgi:hypothetical protein
MVNVESNLLVGFQALIEREVDRRVRPLEEFLKPRRTATAWPLRSIWMWNLWRAEFIVNRKLSGIGFIRRRFLSRSCQQEAFGFPGVGSRLGRKARSRDIVAAHWSEKASQKAVEKAI